jgi:hypothetical protein
MKSFSFQWMVGLALLGSMAASWAQQPLAVGAPSDDTAIALFDGSGDLTNGSLSQFEGKIVLAFYFTPW